MSGTGDTHFDPCALRMEKKTSRLQAAIKRREHIPGQTQQRGMRTHPGSSIDEIANELKLDRIVPRFAISSVRSVLIRAPTPLTTLLNRLRLVCARFHQPS